MDKLTKDLIAVGAATATNCQQCLQKLVDVARTAGAGDDDIRTAVAVGNMVRDGAGGKMGEFVAGMFDDYKSFADKVENPCGCR